MLQFAKIQ